MADEEGRFRLINPLSIRFSQPRIAPHFRDGHLLEEAVGEVYEAPLESQPGQSASAPGEAASGPPPYDVLLVPPFPAIRIISWLPKMRNKDGEAEKDINGDTILGKRAWFALDNRRLHSMQCAAAKRWPRRCCVVVRCIEEVPGQTIRELRKFRTTTEGRSIEVGVRAGDTQPWSWLDAGPPGCKEEQLDPEGLFAEDLHDAEEWAPEAVAAAAGGGENEDPSAASREQRREERRRNRQARDGSDGTRAGGAPERAAGPAAVPAPPAPARVAAAPPPAAAAVPKGTPLRARCPETGWQYVDPAGRVQGPFSLEKMRLWHKHGFFYHDLPMRCFPEDRFVCFLELWPAGCEPFEGQVLRVPP